MHFSWSIENSLLWVLDVSFHEDASRIRKDYSPENMAVLRHFALNLLSRDKSSKSSMRAKRHKATWNLAYFEHLLSLCFFMRSPCCSEDRVTCA
jgi:hypothetical protein